MGRRRKGPSQRNPLPPQTSPRLPTGSWRRPATARIQHHVTASQRVPPPADPTAGPHRLGKLGQEPPEPARGAGRSQNPPPPQNTHPSSSVKEASPPRPLSKHALFAAPQQEQPAQAPRLRLPAPVPVSSLRSEPPRGQQRGVRGPSRHPRLAPSSVQRTTETLQARGQPSRTPGTHREALRAAAQGPQHPACRSPPRSTSGSPHDPVRKQRRMGLGAPSRALKA